jgi:ubiquinone biosynthesis protein COQ9
MDDAAFDSALVAAFFRLAAERGWARVSVAVAAREASLPLDQARVRFPSRAAVLIRFGRMADQAALAEVPSDGSIRDKLFDLLMRRLDALQAHRAGVLALLHALPSEPPTALLLACATRRSMRWMLETAGCSARGLRGELRVRGLVAIWLWTLRAWERDDSADLSATMASLDAVLRRAERVAGWLTGPRAVARAATEPVPPTPEEPTPEEPAPEQPSPEQPSPQQPSPDTPLA